MQMKQCSCGYETTDDFYDDFKSCRKCAEQEIISEIEYYREKIRISEMEIRKCDLLYDRIASYDFSELDQ